MSDNIPVVVCHHFAPVPHNSAVGSCGLAQIAVREAAPVSAEVAFALHKGAEPMKQDKKAAAFVAAYTAYLCFVKNRGCMSPV